MLPDSLKRRNAKLCGNGEIIYVIFAKILVDFGIM